MATKIDNKETTKKKKKNPLEGQVTFDGKINKNKNHKKKIIERERDCR